MATVRSTNMTYDQKFLKRFWGNVDKRGEDECWEWLGGTGRSGYGRIRYTINGKYHTLTAHRVSWEIANKRMIPNGLFVCHSCDTPGCVNPVHLWLGSHIDNMRDRDNKGRTLKGDESPRSKMTSEEVKEIRRLVAEGDSFTEVGKKFGVNRCTVAEAVKGITWRHLPGHRSGIYNHRGSKTPSSKLTESNIPEIRRLLEDGKSQRTIAAMFGVTHEIIGRISRDTAWRHVR